MAQRDPGPGFESLTLVMNRQRLQPYRVRFSREMETRERGFLTSAQLRRYLTLVVNVPEPDAAKKVQEMENASAPVVLTFRRRGMLSSPCVG
jgi:hypothetical protein